MAEETFDLRDIMLEAQAEVQEIMREVMMELALPSMLDDFKMQWLKLPAEMKEKFKTERPEEYAVLMEMM